jgi:AmmeMemoRadiSam system protein A
MTTSDDDRQTLLEIARRAMVAHVSGAPVLSDQRVVPAGVSTRLGGAFVTLHHGGKLRGCIGRVEADRPLLDVIEQSAVAACSADPRFAAVTSAELSDLEIELSLLGTLEAVTDPAEIEIGRHGLLIEKGWHRGLLLPQVASERGWDALQFLAQTCQKAGLPADAWQEGARVWRFEAEVFGEIAPT